MTREQFEEVREFAHKLTDKRLQMPDGQLLDQCQKYLDALLEHASLNFEEFPHEQPIPEDEPYIDDLPKDVWAPPREEPPPPPPSEPAHEVRHPHPTAHKRPTPRKTRR